MLSTPNPDLPIPVHIAIIMDGNGRWARAQGKDRLLGHWQGYQTLKDIVYAADDLGVKFLTVYGFSSENWRRPQDEVGGLMELMLTAIRDELDDLIRNRIRVRVSGRLHQLSPDLQNAFGEAMTKTEENTRLTFNLAINYGGRAEIVDAIRSLAKQVKAGEIDPDAIEESDVSKRLYHPEIPDPDLLIRTAGEVRLSNFLLWETAYSEIWITQTLWPDFDKAHLMAAIADFQKRVRKFGAVIEPDIFNQ